MAAWRSLEAEDAFCEQMVDDALACSFRNGWDRVRLRFWQQREREASMRLRATRAKAAKVSAEVKKPGSVTEGEDSGGSSRDASQRTARPRTDSDWPLGASETADPAPSVTEVAAPLAAQPAPTLFDTTREAA